MEFPDHGNMVEISTSNHSRYITADDIFNVFSQAPNSIEVEFILDCGSSNSNIENSIGSVRSDGSEVPRYIMPPLEHEFYRDYSYITPKKFLPIDSSLDSPKIFLPNSSPISLWTGSADNQSCHEISIDGQPRGLFTHNFCDTIRESNMRIKRTVLRGLTNNKIEKSGFVQTAMLGTSSEILLDANYNHPPSYLMLVQLKKSS